jgi:Helix-turn-helix domain/DDE superfamily endonuclease
MRAPNEATRYAIIAQYQKNPNYSDVGRELGLDPRTVAKWIKRNEKEGNPVEYTSSGRPRAISVAAARAGKDHLLSKGFDNLHQVALKLRSDGLAPRVVHATTLSRRVKAQARVDEDPIQVKTGKPDKDLTPKNKGQRLEFSLANKKRNWSYVMITDRKKSMFSYPGSVVRRAEWVRKGERRVANRPNKPQVCNMYAGITKWGVTKPHFVTGTSKLATMYKNQKGQPARNITCAEYKDVLSQTLLPEGRRLFNQQGISGWVLQQDNDPTHKRSAHEQLKLWNCGGRGGVELLKNWPPNSPDLSPIENAWGHVQATVNAAGCSTFEDFKRTLEKAWTGLDHKYLKKLMNSMPSRLEACVKKGGDKTDY